MSDADRYVCPGDRHQQIVDDPADCRTTTTTTTPPADVPGVPTTGVAPPLPATGAGTTPAVAGAALALVLAGVLLVRWAAARPRSHRLEALR